MHVVGGPTKQHYLLFQLVTPIVTCNCTCDYKHFIFVTARSIILANNSLSVVDAITSSTDKEWLVKGSVDELGIHGIHEDVDEDVADTYAG